MRRAIVLLVVLLGSAPAAGLATAGAEALKYVDAQGVTHYVDSAEKIPEGYRGAATVPRNLPPVTQMDSGFSDAWRREQAIRDAKTRQEEGDRKFKEIAAECAGWLQLIRKPNRRVTVLGTKQEIFNFDECMNERGHPIEFGR